MQEVDRGLQEPVVSNDLVRTVRSWRFEPVLGSRHFQTIAGVIAPHFLEKSFNSKREIIRVSPLAQVAVDFSLQQNPQEHPTVLVIHGMNGSSDSPFPVGIANKAFHYKFNAARVNLRSAGDTGHLSQTLYHAGQSEDLIAVVEAIKKMGLTEKIYIASISLGGNLCLKAVGELGEKAKETIGGLAVISSLIDPSKDNLVDKTYLYRMSALKGLKRAIREKFKQDPENWEVSLLKKINTVYGWDSAFNVGPKPLRWGFESARDYYSKASALPHIPDICVPTLAIHAEDDPILSAEPLRKEEVSKNPNIIALITKHGGHGGFILTKTPKGDLDIHWAENRAIEFFRFLNGHRS